MAERGVDKQVKNLADMQQYTKLKNVPLHQIM